MLPPSTLVGRAIDGSRAVRQLLPVEGLALPSVPARSTYSLARVDPAVAPVGTRAPDSVCRRLDPVSYALITGTGGGSPHQSGQSSHVRRSHRGAAHRAVLPMFGGGEYSDARCS